MHGISAQGVLSDQNREHQRWIEAMTPNRKSLLLTVGLLVLLMGAPAVADEGLGGLQLFAPADISPYGRGPQPNEGYFFSYDGLYWSVSTPKTAMIGQPNVVRNAFILGVPPLFLAMQQQERSGLDTSPFTADFTPGTRIEFGRVQDHQGWLFSTFRLNSQTQDPVYVNAVPVIFDDPFLMMRGFVPGQPFPPGMPLSMTFTGITVANEVDTWGAEINYLYRTHEMHGGTRLSSSPGRATWRSTRTST
jgi:hypothetical protein